MIPGLSLAAEAALSAMLVTRATRLSAAALADLPFLLFGPEDAELAALGIEMRGHPDVTVVVTDPARRIGRIVIEVGAPGSLVFLDNREAGGQLYGNVRMLGRDCAILFPELRHGYIALHDVFLRSHGQVLLWGLGATAVGLSIEHEGEGRTIVIGDDALISGGVWIRNHDMHALVDLKSGQRINPPPVDIVIERHVWIGQNAMLLGCQRVGTGSVIGAASLVKGIIEPRVAVAGMPARVIRTDVSWGRAIDGMDEDERRLVQQID